MPYGITAIEILACCFGSHGGGCRLCIYRMGQTTNVPVSDKEKADLLFNKVVHEIQVTC